MRIIGHVRTRLLGRSVLLPVTKAYDSGSVLAMLDTGHLIVIKAEDVIEFTESRNDNRNR